VKFTISKNLSRNNMRRIGLENFNRLRTQLPEAVLKSEKFKLPMCSHNDFAFTR